MRLQAKLFLALVLSAAAVCAQEADEAATAESTSAEATPEPVSIPVPAPSPAVTTAAVRPVTVDQLDLGTTSITGNQELPKVLYIVPWKRSDLGDLVGRPVDTLLDEVLAPVDPEVFERHLSYYETLHGQSEEE